VVEQAHALLDKDDAELLGRLEDGAVVLAAAGGGDVLCAGAGGAEDVVGEGELLRVYMVSSYFLISFFLTLSFFFKGIGKRRGAG